MRDKFGVFWLVEAVRMEMYEPNDQYVDVCSSFHPVCKLMTLRIHNYVQLINFPSLYISKRLAGPSDLLNLTDG